MTVTLGRVPVRLRALLPQRRAVSQPREAATPMTAATVATLTVLLTISLLAAWFALYATVLSGLQQRHNNSVLYKKFREELSAATAPIGLDGPIAVGAPIAVLSLPAAGLDDEIIVEGTSSRELAQGVGHFRSSPLPGQPGVSYIFGRSLTFGAPFDELEDLAKGTKFEVTTGQGTFHYAVEDVRRVGDPLTALPVGGSRLVLVTSTGSALTPSDSLYVDANLLDKTVPAASARLSAVPDSEKPFGTDHSQLVQLIFWLQALLAVVIFTVWAWLRWGRWQAWVIGVPLVFATLWGASGTAMTLLPNLV